MFKKTLALATAAAVTAGTLSPIAAEAAPRKYERGYDRNDNRGYQQARNQDRRYNNGRYAYDARQNYRGNGYGYGYNNSYRKCDKGNGGTVIGAIAGGLLGNEVAGRGDRTLGAIIGAGVGAVAGRSIDRSC